MGCERCVQAEENSLGWYVRNTVEPLLIAAGRAKIVDVERSTH